MIHGKIINLFLLEHNPVRNCHIVVFFYLILYVSVNNYSALSEKQGLMCLAQGHNTKLFVRLKPTTPWSRDSTTELLHSLNAALCNLFQQTILQLLSKYKNVYTQYHQVNQTL